jgi:hypothetical protein
VITSTGHLVSLSLDGTMMPGQISYSAASCAGTAYLNSGGSTSGPIPGNAVVYSGSQATLLVPATVDANGLAQNGSFTSATIDNPTCYASAGTNHGYQPVTVAPAAVGLPEYPLAAPLTYG